MSHWLAQCLRKRRTPSLGVMVELELAVVVVIQDAVPVYVAVLDSMVQLMNEKWCQCSAVQCSNIPGSDISSNTV